jgi:phosphoglycolate phosphatase
MPPEANSSSPTQPPIGPQAVVFDLDGTLLDSLEDIGSSANQVLAKLGLPTHPLDAYRYFVGEGVAVLFTRAIKDGAERPELVAECVQGFRDVYGAGWNIRSQPYEGILELLDELARREIATAVLSNKPHDFTCRCVEHFFPDYHFRVVLGARHGSPRKPDPAGLLEIMKVMGLSPQNTLYLGDTSVDMETARAAGVPALGALWGFRTAEELKSHGAAAVVTHPREVVFWLEGIHPASTEPETRGQR